MNKSSALGVLAFAPVALVAGWLCWPEEKPATIIKAQEIHLVSPDGKRTIKIAVTNNAATISTRGEDGIGTLVFSSSDNGAGITALSHSGEPIQFPLVDFTHPSSQ